MFYERLETICLKNGITVSALVKALELSTSKVTAWKNGSVPKGDILIKIADYFNVSVDYLLGRTVYSDGIGSASISFNDIRILLSDECLIRIIAHLGEQMKTHGYDTFLEHTKYSYKEVKEFLTTDLSLHRNVNLLFDLLTFFDTNVYAILKDSVFKGYALYEKLDTDDKAEIRVRIKQLLEESNYTAKETSFGASTPAEDIVQEVTDRLNTPINTK